MHQTTASRFILGVNAPEATACVATTQPLPDEEEDEEEDLSLLVGLVEVVATLVGVVGVLLEDLEAVFAGTAAGFGIKSAGRAVGRGDVVTAPVGRFVSVAAAIN